MHNALFVLRVVSYRRLFVLTKDFEIHHDGSAEIWIDTIRCQDESGLAKRDRNAVPILPLLDPPTSFFNRVLDNVGIRLVLCQLLEEPFVMEIFGPFFVRYDLLDAAFYIFFFVGIERLGIGATRHVGHRKAWNCLHGRKFLKVWNFGACRCQRGARKERDDRRRGIGRGHGCGGHRLFCLLFLLTSSKLGG